MRATQEAEDVARAMEQIEPLIDSALDLMEVRAITMPILARLVREGQIRELEALVAMKGGVPWTYIHARIAALKGEG